MLATNATEAQLTNLFSYANVLVNGLSGQVNSAAANGGVVPVAEINTLADIVATCTESDGSTCGPLAANTIGSGTPVNTNGLSNTFEFIHSIAANPTNNVLGIYSLATSATPYAPVLGGAPADWTLTIAFPTPLASQTSLTLNPATTSVGSSVSALINVSNADSTPLSGTVSCLVGGVVVGPSTQLGSLGSATISLNGLPAGSDSVSCTYSGDSNDVSSSASGTELVSATMPTSLQVTSSTTSTPFGSPVVLSASVSTATAVVPTGIVNFYDGSRVIAAAVLMNGQSSVVTATLTPGSHQITATFNGSGMFGDSSGILNQSQNVQNTPPITSVALSPKRSIQGAEVDASVSVTSAPGFEPRGTVACSTPQVSAVTATLDANGHAKMALPNLPLGVSTVTCTFVSSQNGASSSGQSDETVVGSGAVPTGSMQPGLTLHIAASLPNGKVLVAGGLPAGQYGNNTQSASQFYDPSSGTFTNQNAPAMQTPRQLFQATQMPDGTILITGGLDVSTYTAAAEYYDPVSNTFRVVGSMTTSRFEHTATLLPSGQVLISGGRDNSNVPTSSAELYNPLTNSFSATGSMTHARASHAAILLNTGKVLIVGGSDGNTSGLNTAELYDPSSGSFSSLPNMSYSAEDLTATLLPDGTVLLAGGDYGNNTTVVSSAAIYDPVANSFTSVGPMTSPRSQQTATLLGSGQVLIAGGATSSSFAPTSSMELYDPTSQSFTGAGNMSSARISHTATPVSGNAVLLAGGLGSNGQAQATADLYSFNITEGLVDLKYLVVGVQYAPPGSGSSVTYTQGSGLTDTNAIDTDINSTTKITVTHTYKAALNVGSLLSFGGTSSISASTNYGYDTDSSTTYQIVNTESNGIQVPGPANSAIGIDHDYDRISIFFDPQYMFELPNSSYPSINWAGLAYKGCSLSAGISSNCDPNNYGNPDVVDIPVLCLKNPYITGYCTQYAPFFNRAWDNTGNGGLTLQDMQTILQEDPYVANPNYNPTVLDGRFAETPGTIQFPLPPPGGLPGTTTGGSTYQSTTTNAQSITREYGVSFEFDDQVTGSFIGGMNLDLKVIAGTDWKHKTTSSAATQTSNAANWSIKAPSTTDNYSGPIIFNPWHDNVYGSFMFFAPSRQTIPPASIVTSVTSLTFGGVTTFGTTSTAQIVTVTNNSAVSMVMSATSTNATTLAAYFSDGSFSLVNDSCSGVTLLANGSCTFGIKFSPLAADLQASGQTVINGTMIVQGVEIAPGSSNVLITTDVPLTGTGSH